MNRRESYLRRKKNQSKLCIFSRNEVFRQLLILILFIFIINCGYKLPRVLGGLVGLIVWCDFNFFPKSHLIRSSVCKNYLKSLFIRLIIYSNSICRRTPSFGILINRTDVKLEYFFQYYVKNSRSQKKFKLSKI